MKILIVEDEQHVAEDLKAKLEELQYRVSAIADSFESALQAIEQEMPDLALLDIELKGALTGIDLAEKLARIGIPYIYLSGIQDMNTYLRAKDTSPLKNLPKPINLLSLRNALLDIDLSKAPLLPTIHLITDKDGNKLRIDPNNIMYVKAAKVYCDVFFTDKNNKSTLTMPMGTFLEKLDWPDIIRIHNSHAINLKHVKSLRGNEVEMTDGEFFRFTDSYREILHRHLKTF